MFVNKYLNVRLNREVLLGPVMIMMMVALGILRVHLQQM